MHWRAHLPENCPPDDAIPINGVFYRLINGAHPKPQDFLSYRELYPERAYDEPECIVCGVSIYSEIEGIMRLLKRTPALRKKHLAKGELFEKYGNCKNTSSNTHSSHYSWWIPNGVEPSKAFTVIKFPQVEN